MTYATTARRSRKPQVQRDLFAASPSIDRFPATRYQGSKLKLLHWIESSLDHLQFHTALDLFSGTACVAYLFKTMGKQVTANDYLKFNQVVAEALLVNDANALDPRDAAHLFSKQHSLAYDNFVERTFEGIFYLPEENRQLDVLAQNIARLHGTPAWATALFALYQACIAKRPYNLFHRANLYMRTAEVERSFGNKATWDRSLRSHFDQALNAANDAVFRGKHPCTATCNDFLDVPGTYDLVYMDPPYLNKNGTGVDYLDFYHFLEGLTEYERWTQNITLKYKHRPYQRRPNPWYRGDTILAAFDQAIERYGSSIIAISYRSNGTPPIEEITQLFRRHGRKDARRDNLDYQYVLSHTRGQEVLLVSEP